MRTSVDLPEPDSPTMPRLPPSGIATSTPSSATRSARPPNSDVRGSGYDAGGSPYAAEQRHRVTPRRPS